MTTNANIDILATLKDIPTKDLIWIDDHLLVNHNSKRFESGYSPITQNHPLKIVNDNLDFIYDHMFITSFNDEDELIFTVPGINRNGKEKRKPLKIFTLIGNWEAKGKKKCARALDFYELKCLKSRSDFNREQRNNPNQIIWDNTRNNSIRPGCLFSFVHNNAAAGNIAELHYVEDTGTVQSRRSWWLARHANREVITLSEDKVIIPVDTFKKWLVTRSGRPMKEKNRLQGTTSAVFNDDLKMTIRVEIAARQNKSEEIEAKIWNLVEHPLDNDIFEIVNQEANKFNDKVGSIKFYPNQIKNAAIACQMLIHPLSNNTGILGADTQSGKSATAELVGHCFRRILVLKGILEEDDAIGIIFMLHISDTNLKSQTDKGLKESFRQIEPGILKSTLDYKTYATSQMLSNNATSRIETTNERFTSQYKCKKIILISDELQSAMTLGQQISKIYDKLDVNNTSSSNVYVFGTTATPNRYYAYTSVKDQIPIYWGDNGDSYYGIQHMYEDGKIKNLGHISDEVYADHVKTYLEDNKFIIVRVQNQDAKKQFWIKLQQELGFYIEEFNCNEGNISELNTYLQDPPEFRQEKTGTTKVVIMLKMAGRAGQRFDTFKHVSALFDSFSGDDAIVQSFPGRACGNQPNRREECPVIFTNLPKVEQYLVDRDHLKNGQLPPLQSARKHKDKILLKVAHNSEFICVSTSSDEYKEHKEKVFAANGKEFAAEHCDEQKVNLARKILKGKWPDIGRCIAIKNKKATSFVQHDKHIKKLIEKYPDLLKPGMVLIPKEMIVDTGRKIGDSVLQQK